MSLQKQGSGKKMKDFYSVYLSVLSSTYPYIHPPIHLVLNAGTSAAPWHQIRRSPVIKTCMTGTAYAYITPHGISQDRKKEARETLFVISSLSSYNPHKHIGKSYVYILLIWEYAFVNVHCVLASVVFPYTIILSILYLVSCRKDADTGQFYTLMTRKILIRSWEWEHQSLWKIIWKEAQITKDYKR